MSDRLYGQDFYNSQMLGSLQSAQVYLYHLFSLWGVPGSVADLGCGRGTWLATCCDLGVKRAVGFDGTWNSQADMLDPRIEFHPTNLEQSIPLTERFDLVISLEVAEHLQPESSDVFVESLSNMSEAVLFGAAFTGQPGANHINTRRHSFWAAKFFERGYILFDLFRPTFWDDDRVEPCYRQNTFLYVKPGHSLCLALEKHGFTGSRDTRLMDCVHPAVYLGLLNEYNRLQLTPGVGQPLPVVQNQTSATGEVGPSPDLPDTLERIFEQAETQIAANLLADAADTYRLALAREPNNPECLLRLSHVLLRMKSYEECFHHVRHFLRIVDDVAYGYYLAGHAAREIGRWAASRQYLMRAVELDPDHMYARVLCCMSAFTICMNQAETLTMLGAYRDELAQLIDGTNLDCNDGIKHAVEGIGALTPFFLPYLGYNVTDLQRQYGSWVCAVMAAQYPQFTHPLPPRSANGRIKLGIVSHYFHNHSNWKIPIRGWLEQLDRTLCSIHCFYSGETSDAATEVARSLADSFLQNGDAETLATAIAERGCDILIYPGIGMDTVTLKLAALRLAPVQCASWGHPVTTGMPTMDYFISSDLMEPVDGDSHYTEKLVRLPNLSIWYEPLEQIMDATGNLAIPGIEKHDVVILCSQNLLKYQPRYDFVFPAIAEAAKNARFVFIASQIAELNEKFMRRLEQAFQDRGLTARDHVVVMPHLNAPDFLALNARADIVLDSIEWSGCNTVLESLSFNKPIVTLPGSFMRGRHAAAILKMMGVEDTIAASAEEYVAIAARLANDAQWRTEISTRIHQNKQMIYRDRACIDALEEFLKNVSGRSPSGPG